MNLLIVSLFIISIITYPQFSQAIVYGWGSNDRAQLGIGNYTTYYYPYPLTYYNNIPILDMKVAATFHMMLAANGSVYTSGYQFYGQFALGTTSPSQYLTPIRSPALNTSLDILLVGSFCNANMNTGLLGWGNVAGYARGKQAGSFPRIQTGLPEYHFEGRVLSLSSVGEGVFVILANNTVWAAGSNANGKLGIGSSDYFTVQYNFVEMNFWRLNNIGLKKIFPSQSSHVCALSVDMRLYCWGLNSYGQLGVGDTNIRSQPTRVAFFDDNGYIPYQASYGDTHTVVLTCGGRVFVFGSNMYGQLGLGIPDVYTHSIPTEVIDSKLDRNVLEIVTGLYQTFVRTSDDEWYIWGAGASGSLGMGSATDLVRPTLNNHLKTLGVNRVSASSQSLHFYGWHDDFVLTQRAGCPVLEDECVTGNNLCSPNGTCSDLERGYKCSCKLGWIGDGYINGTGCFDPYSCEIRGSECHPLARCRENSEGGGCECNDGYEGDGYVFGSGCIDIDECSLGSPCAEYAYCTNTQPKYNCTCIEGYHGDANIDGCTKSCAPGNYSIGRTLCAPCAPGYWNNITNAIVCQRCPEGTYNPDYGVPSLEGCQPCPVGGYSTEASVLCQLCIHGYTNDVNTVRTSDATCYPCPVGQYGYYGECIDCLPGSYSSQIGAKQCSLCAPGTNSSATASTSCSYCPAGFYSRGGAASCTACPAGTFSRYSGSRDCDKCPSGWSTNGLKGQTECTPCAQGFFAGKMGSTSCFVCPSGFYANKTGSSYCERCPRGTYNDATRQSSCIPCASGNYAPGTGSTKCTACPTGSQSNGITCIPCTAGTYRDGTSFSCQQCKIGTFVAVTGISSCYSCNPGSYASGTGSSYCPRCPVNTFTNATSGYTDCDSCGTGWYSLGGASVCQPQS